MTVPKIKYLTNKDLLKEIHLSKNTYCSYTLPEHGFYDLILPNLAKINIRTIAEAKRNCAAKLSKQAHEAAAHSSLLPVAAQPGTLWAADRDPTLALAVPLAVYQARGHLD